jgi:hypothetical protein
MAGGDDMLPKMMGRLIQGIGIIASMVAMWLAWPLFAPLFFDDAPMVHWIVTDYFAAFSDFIRYLLLISVLAPGIILFSLGSGMRQRCAARNPFAKNQRGSS